MSNYQVYKNKTTNLKVRKVTASNYFSLSYLVHDYDLVVDEMLETIRCQEEVLKWYKSKQTLEIN